MEKKKNIGHVHFGRNSLHHGKGIPKREFFFSFCGQQRDDNIWAKLFGYEAMSRSRCLLRSRLQLLDISRHYITPSTERTDIVRTCDVQSQGGEKTHKLSYRFAPIDLQSNDIFMTRIRFAAERSAETPSTYLAIAIRSWEILKKRRGLLFFNFTAHKPLN
jgi:hypothetical protein